MTTVSTCFGHHYAHHQEKRPRVTAYGFFLLVVLDVAVCGAVVLTPYNVAPQYRNLPHPTLPAKKPICSNTWSFLLMMSIKMPETCRDSQQSTSELTINHLYCCILLVFFLHASKLIFFLLVRRYVNAGFIYRVVILSDKYRLLSAGLSLRTWLTHQRPYCACIFGRELLYLESS